MLVEMSISNNTAFAISDACDEGSEWNSIVLWSLNVRNLSSSVGIARSWTARLVYLLQSCHTHSMYMYRKVLPRSLSTASSSDRLTEVHLDCPAQVSQVVTLGWVQRCRTIECG